MDGIERQARQAAHSYIEQIDAIAQRILDLTPEEEEMPVAAPAEAEELVEE